MVIKEYRHSFWYSAINTTDSFITLDSYRARNDHHKYRHPNHDAEIR